MVGIALVHDGVFRACGMQGEGGHGNHCRALGRRYVPRTTAKVSAPNAASKWRGPDQQWQLDGSAAVA
eukprot:5630556-Amphidinium_carterae.2